MREENDPKLDKINKFIDFYQNQAESKAMDKGTKQRSQKRKMSCYLFFTQVRRAEMKASGEWEKLKKMAQDNGKNLMVLLPKIFSREWAALSPQSQARFDVSKEE